jgi:hypothetical protein
MGPGSEMNGENRLFLMRNRRSRLHTLTGHSPNMRHFIMSDGVCVSVIPRDGDTTPRRSDNYALIGCAGFPANAVANLVINARRKFRSPISASRNNL